MLENTIDSGAFNSSPEQPIESLSEQIINDKLEALNISSEDLEREVESFKDLSDGQKVLALENLQQSILGEIKEDALADYQSRFGKMTGKAEGVSKFNLHNAGVLGKNLWLGITKQYKLAKFEKAKAKELLAGGLEMHQEVLTQLTEGLKNYGPEAEIDAEGEVRINYLSKPEGLSEEQGKLFDQFNQSANTLSKIPDEWRYDSAKEAERKKFNQAQFAYEDYKNEVMYLLYEKEGSACLRVNKVDSQVRLNQFLNANPDVEKQLLKIKDQSLVTKVISKVVAERGLYMGAGMASRTFATLGLGMLGSMATFGGVVVGAGAIGYFRASGRAKETMRQKDIAGRRGKKDEGELSRIFALGGGKQKGKVNEQNEISVGLGDKLNALVTRFENETDLAKKEDLANRLKTRLEYTKKYLDDGKVDFGSQEKRLGHQYNLMTSMAQAEVYLDWANYGDEQRQKVEAKVESLIYDELDAYDKLVDTKRKNYVVKQAQKGMLMAMGLATVGRVISEVVYGHNAASDHLGQEKQSPEIIQSAKSASAPSKVAEHLVVERPVPVGPNDQEVVSYLTEDKILKNNLDLKTTLLDQKITVNVLEKGQGIGNYANVNNETPVNFVQADGSVEVHGAGEVYVHPGDRVIQTEDGQIYVIRDSGINGLQVHHEDLSDVKMESIKTESLDNDVVSDDNIVTDNSLVSKDDVVNADYPSYLEMIKTKTNVLEHKSDVLGDSETEVHKGFFSKVKEFFGGSKKVDGNDLSVKVPESFSKGDAVDQGLVSQWNLLDTEDQTVYNDFAANTTLYSTNPKLAITNFLGQIPTEVVNDAGSTDFVATLDNGHTVVFGTEDGGMIMNVNDAGFNVVNPENIIAARKLIKTDISDDLGDVSDNALNTGLTSGDNLGNEKISLINQELLTTEPSIWAVRPDVKNLVFDHQDFTPAQELQVQEFYEQRVAVLEEIKKQYAEIKLKYSDSPKLDRFEEVVKTYYSVENERVKNIIEGAQDKDKFLGNIDQSLKEVQNPQAEVTKTMNRIISKIKLKV